VNLINAHSYEKQAKLFLVAFWDIFQGTPKLDEVWDFTEKYYATDLFLKGLSPLARDSASTSLDEHGFHVFLERHIRPMTVLEARAKLREADFSFDGRVSLIEFFVWHYSCRTDDFLRKAPRDPKVLEGGDQTPEMRAANAALAAVRSEINKIEMEKARLEEDSELGGIKGARAKNELAQLLSRDKTDLNRALLTAEAAVRKVGGSGVNVPPAILWWMERELQEMKKYRPRAK